jgi:hypothetical protein
LKRVSTVLLLAAVAGYAAAQGTVLYAPVRDIKDQGIQLQRWGSGTISQTDETAYEGTHSLRVSSRNFFQGGILHWERPVDLGKDFSDKSNMLRVVFKLAEGGVISPGGGGDRGGDPGLSGSASSGRPPGQGGPPGLSGMGNMGGGGSVQAGLDQLRVIITTTDGKRSEAYVPASAGFTEERGWNSVAIPLQAIRGFDRTNKIVKSVALAPDQTATFYLGDLRVVNDTTPLRGEISPISLNIGAGQEVRLTATGSGGASILRYTWDFGDGTDGDQVDAEGQVITRRFRKPGTYTITVTISDFFGLKQPYKTTIRAVVNG